MRIASLMGAACSAALLAACGLGQPNYPSFGQADYRIEGMTTDANGATTQTVVYRNGPKMRVEAVLPEYGQSTVVFDESTNAAYVLNPAPAQASPAPAASPATAAPAPQATNAEAQNPAPAPATGVAVRVADANAPRPMEAPWAALGAQNARYVGRCSAAGEEGHEWRPRNGDVGVRTACITSDGIVLRVTQDGAPLWQASALQRGEQDLALFGVPPGYQVIDPQAVAEQVGENLENLGSVTGAPNPR